MSNKSDKEKNDKENGTKRKGSKFVLASIDKRARQLESMLKLTKPIAQFVKRVEFLENKLNEKGMVSPPSSNGINPSYSVQTQLKPVNNALKDEVFIEAVANSFMNSSAHSILFNSEQDLILEMEENLLLKSVLIILSCTTLTEDCGYNLNQTENYCLGLIATQLPKAYLKPTLSNMKALMLYGFYFFKLRKIYSAEKYIDSSFNMFQTIASENGLVKINDDFPELIKNKMSISENNEIVPLLSQVWPILLLAKRYIAILSGKPFVINDINTLTSKFIDQSDFFSNQILPNPKNITYSGLVSTMIEFTFSINSQIYISRFKPKSKEFLQIIQNNVNKESQEIERLIYDWYKQISVDTYEPNTYNGIKKIIFENSTIKEKTYCFNYYFLHFFTILLYWPTILCYKYPLPKDYVHFCTILSSAMELFNLIQNWDTIHTEYNLTPNPKELPFSMRTVLMTAITFLNHMYHTYTISPTTAIVSKNRVIYLEKLLNRYNTTFEEYKSVIEDLNEAKLEFNFNQFC
ncbi:hypothetical protein K502DRAFT_329633 [Neoconidiobolus thromboides FSU 785]|nr:hypothetical protein K502DRAFT_329633 [Neoconidiobolus thromboides FSU 785]